MSIYDIDADFDALAQQYNEDLPPVPTDEDNTDTPQGDPARIPVELLGTDVAPLAILGARALADIPPMEWLIENHIPAGLLSVLWGQGGCFKSFQALDWALSVASGTPWQGLGVRSGRVVYVSGEGASGLYARVEAWEEAHPTADISKFGVVPHAVRLLDDADVKRLRKTLALLRQPPSLIVLDTLQRTMGGLGDENNTQDMSKFIATIDSIREEFGCAVLVVHHSGADGARARGNSVLRNSADAMWQMKRDGVEGSPDPRVTLYCDKLKDAEEQPGRAMVARRSGTSIVLDPLGTTVPPIVRTNGVPYSSRPF